jgi:hypothetical protein
MPNNSDARRNKREKNKKRRGETSPSPPQQVTEESVESFLSRSATDSGFQDGVEDVTWESVAGQAAMDDSLSSLTRPPSSLEPKLSRKEERRRMRKVALEKEMENESDIDLSDEEDSKAKDPSPRKLSLSPTQFLQSRATGPLNRNRAMRPEGMKNPSVFASPAQVQEAKESGASVDVPVEAVACVIASGANSVQQDKQGHTQGSSSVSPPSPSYNLPPAERAQVLRRSLAADLIQAGSGRSLLTPPARH